MFVAIGVERISLLYVDVYEVSLIAIDLIGCKA
jgi:hypothetical protein